MKYLLILTFLLAACAHKNTYQTAEPVEAKELMGEWIMDKPAYFHLDGQDMSMKVRLDFTDTVMKITSECAIEKLGLSDSVSIDAKIKLLPNHRFDVLESVNISKNFAGKKKKGDKSKKESPVFTCNASYAKGLVNYVLKEDKLSFLDSDGRVDVSFVRRGK